MTDVNQFLNTLLLDPEFSDYMDAFKKYLKIEFNCHAIAKIDKFYPNFQWVDASIVYTKTEYSVENGIQIAKNIQYPLILSAPVVIMSGGPAYLTFPIQAGDECLILFNDRDMDNWWAGSANSPPNSTRLHSLSDPIALVGIRSKPNKISDYDLARAVLAYGTTMVRVGESKVGILNENSTLNGVLQDLIDEIKNLTDATKDVATNIALLTVVTAGVTSTVPVNAATFTTLATNLATIKANMITTATEIGSLLE